MRFVTLFLVGAMICKLGCAADDSSRAALISRVESQYVSASVIGTDSPIVAMALSGARSLNPGTGDATWNEVRDEVASVITSAATTEGSDLGVLLRSALDTLSTAELEQLSKLFSDPAYLKFEGSIVSSDRGKRMTLATINVALSMGSVVNGVLEKHGLNVPH